MPSVETTALHQAAQYLAWCANSFIPPTEDTSHSNLGWDAEHQCLVTRPFGKNENLRLALDYAEFKLRLMDGTNEQNEQIAEHLLAGKTHTSIMEWLQAHFKVQNLSGELNTDLPYELPYEDFPEGFTFPEVDLPEINRLADMRSQAQEQLERVIQNFSDTDPVRIWPHHFDTGALITLQRKDEGAAQKTIGLGLAIPDTMVDDYYYYASPWAAEETPGIDDLPALPEGKWMAPDWNGGVLKASKSGDREISIFLEAAVESLKRILNS